MLTMLSKVKTLVDNILEVHANNIIEAHVDLWWIIVQPDVYC